MFTTIFWLLSSKIYAFYVEYFSHYDIFYGSMSNILVLLFWVYILAYIFTLGMSFNQTGVIQETIELRRSDIAKRLKKEQDIVKYSSKVRLLAFIFLANLRPT